MKISNVSHVMYPTTDRERALDFLVNALGGRLMQRVPDITYVGFGNTLVEITEDKQGLDVNQLSTPYAFGLEVDNIEEVVAAAEAHGGGLAREIFIPRSFTGRQTTIFVPGGANIALREYDPSDGPQNMNWTPPQ